MGLTEDIQTKRLKQNINNLSIIEILRLPSLSLFQGEMHNIMLLCAIDGRKQ